MSLEDEIRVLTAKVRELEAQLRGAMLTIEALRGPETQIEDLRRIIAGPPADIDDYTGLPAGLPDGVKGIDGTWQTGDVS